MRSARTLLGGAAAFAAAAAVALSTALTPAEAASVRYVALGDSYSSGVGTGSESGSCDRSPQAYGPLWAARNAASFTFAACSGAKIPDVIRSQLPALRSTTTLVSVTIGGNDVGFGTIMKTCVLSSDSACRNSVSSGVSTAKSTLPGELSTMFSGIRAHAPNARIVFLGYPRFYDLAVPACIGLSRTKHVTLDNGINALDTVLQAAAARNGVTFADVRGRFSGHELCSGSGWLHSVDFARVGESYHPTAAGQASGYLPVLTSAAAAVGQ
jgi:lysophospholipase L1-like esterase